MTARDNGGPAFPRDHAHDGHNGMDLRDFFAAKAMQGLLANPERYRYIADLVATHQLTQSEASDKNAHKAFLIADAMLKARAAS